MSTQGAMICMFDLAPAELFSNAATRAKGKAEFTIRRESDVVAGVCDRPPSLDYRRTSAGAAQ